MQTAGRTTLPIRLFLKLNCDGICTVGHWVARSSRTDCSSSLTTRHSASISRVLPSRIRFSRLPSVRATSASFAPTEADHSTPQVCVPEEPEFSFTTPAYRLGLPALQLRQRRAPLDSRLGRFSRSIKSQPQ